MMLKLKICSALVLGVFLFSCSKKAALPKATEEVKTQKTIAELPTAILEGKKLYENSCGSCHKLFPAAKHDKAGWVKTLERMAPKAKITEDEKNLVYNYLTYNM